ncbi:hypothetical protein [Budvicia diplopodorum]|uniref:hypothetical protein n=1 Tax=Budvicia diplopodorum TaxID=1119056 RepID=UPI001358F8B1|nr:hypothetical protein [Budvicia diplopodorum]
MILRCLFALSLCFCASLSFAQTDWKEINFLPQYAGALRSANGFSGMIVATSNSEWNENWTISPDSVPDLYLSNSVGTGENIYVLVFFSNPTLNENKAADIACDLQLIRPDGSESFSKKDVVCFKGLTVGGVTDFSMVIPVIDFTSEESDLKGIWRVKMTLKDKLGKQRLPLVASFTNE